MCTVFSHTVVGLTLGRALYGRQPPRFWVASGLLPALPDADVLLHWNGVPYAHMFGHRGFTHSPFFAVFFAAIVVVLFFPTQARDWRRSGLRLWLFFSLLLATHGVMDAMTTMGLGIAFLAPFSDARFFLPWSPFPTPPIGIAAFFDGWISTGMVSEVMRIWLPCLAVLVPIEAWRWWRRKRLAHASR